MNKPRRRLSVKQSMGVIFLIGIIAFLVYAIPVLIFLGSVQGALILGGSAMLLFMPLAWLGIVWFFRGEVEGK